jgi:hypothetical protein
MYIVYGIVVGSALWGPKRKTVAGGDPSPAIRTLKVSRTLCVSALLWIGFLLAIISIPRSAWINTIASAAAMGVGACWYFWRTPRKREIGSGPESGSERLLHTTSDGI